MAATRTALPCADRHGENRPARAVREPSGKAHLQGTMAALGAGVRRALGRRSRQAVALLAVALSVIPVIGRADAGPRRPDLERLAASARPGPGPAGWVGYCLGRPADCLEASPPARVVWSGAVAGLVARVQREVNAAIEPTPEPASRDLWVVGPRAGDCEDFALTKREALRAAGLPRGALRLATAYTETGEYHTVLTVQTERGTVVLDNRFAEPRPLADLPYRWVMVELPDQPLSWAHL